VVLIALPFLLFFVMLHIKAGYVQMLWTDPLGIKMSVFGLDCSNRGSARDQENRGHQGLIPCHLSAGQRATNDA